MLTRLGRWCARHRWLVIAAWAVVAVAIGVAERSLHAPTRDTFSVPGSDSQRAVDLLNEKFPSAGGASAQVVFEADSPLTTPAYKSAIEQSVRRVQALSSVSSAPDPFDDQIVGLVPYGGTVTPTVAKSLISADETVAYSPVSYSVPQTSLTTEAYADLVAATSPAGQAGLRVYFGGGVPDAFNAPPPGISKYSDKIGLGLAVIVLLIALGSVTSMAVPISVALTALSISGNLLNIVARWVTIGSVAPTLGMMIGLGVGIDYSLFIVSRFRQNLAAGYETEEAVGLAIGTSGSAVLFAGVTVAIALSGLVVVDIPYLTMLGFSAAMYVAITVIAALTLVPAILGALGPRVNSLRIHKRDETGDTANTVSARWARVTARRPVYFAIAALVILVIIAAPVTQMRLGFLDDGDQPESLTQRQAYDVISEKFGPGQTGPLIIAIKLPPIDRHDYFELSDLVSAFDSIDNALTTTAGIKSVSLPVPNRTLTDGPVPTAAIIQVVPSDAPNSPQTKQLVANLRNNVIPGALVGSSLDPDYVYVGGTTAILLDLTDAISTSLPWFIAIVVLTAFLLLMLVFRSIYVPATAALMNLLSIGAAYGVLVVVFQNGWGAGAIGLRETIPIVAFVPVMMFAILFGLSMDYEVFLLSRIREEYDRTGDTRESVVSGLAATARVITSAALIMISVFLAFVPNPDPTVKMIGLGMAAAVLIDSTIIRMMLVPSTLVIGGRVTWWLPEWLSTRLPRLNIEGAGGDQVPDGRELGGAPVVEDYDGTPLVNGGSED